MALALRLILLEDQGVGEGFSKDGTIWSGGLHHLNQSARPAREDLIIQGAAHSKLTR